jgi:hypothetical protein
MVCAPEMGQRRCNALAPAPERSFRRKETVCEASQAKHVAIDVLRAARKPLHAKEIAKVLESGR